MRCQPLSDFVSKSRVRKRNRFPSGRKDVHKPLCFPGSLRRRDEAARRTRRPRRGQRPSVRSERRGSGPRSPSSGGSRERRPRRSFGEARRSPAAVACRPRRNRASESRATRKGNSRHRSLRAAASPANRAISGTGAGAPALRRRKRVCVRRERSRAVLRSRRSRTGLPPEARRRSERPATARPGAGCR